MKQPPGFNAELALVEPKGRYGSFVASQAIQLGVYPSQVIQPPDVDYWPLGPWLRPYDPCIYGNFCGPACSGPGEPIDALDRCCKAHDDCYTEKGYFACDCDLQLLNCVAGQTPNILTDGPNATFGALLVSTYFGLQYLLHCPIEVTAKEIAKAWHNPVTTVKKAAADLPNPVTEIGKAWHNPFDTLAKAFGGN